MNKLRHLISLALHLIKIWLFFFFFRADKRKCYLVEVVLVWRLKRRKRSLHSSERLIAKKVVFCRASYKQSHSEEKVNSQISFSPPPPSSITTVCFIYLLWICPPIKFPRLCNYFFYCNNYFPYALSWHCIIAFESTNNNL